MQPYEERLLYEYTELTDSLNRLTDILDKWDNDELDFEPECTLEQLCEQWNAMKNYVYAIEKRNDFKRLMAEDAEMLNKPYHYTIHKEYYWNINVNELKETYSIHRRNRGEDEGARVFGGISTYERALELIRKDAHYE